MTFPQILFQLQGKSLKSTLMHGGMVSVAIEYLTKVKEGLGIEEK